MVSQFYQYFESVYGSERWSALFMALKVEYQTQGLILNRPDADYFLDPASVLPAIALAVQPGDSVLDTCAAPGGKTLILARSLQGRGQLVAAEPSPDRRTRLKSVLRKHLSAEELVGVTVSGRKGEEWGRLHPERYDRILLDAPCTGERHLLETTKGEYDWTLSRTTQNSRRQVSLLCSAYDALKPGGRLVYSTCSIHSIENDAVVERLLAKRQDAVVVSVLNFMEFMQIKARNFINVDTAQFSQCEATTYGIIALPDRLPGWGPIFLSIIEKP